MNLKFKPKKLKKCNLLNGHILTKNYKETPILMIYIVNNQVKSYFD